MKKILITLLAAAGTTAASAQKTSNATFLTAENEKADVCVPFKYTDTGVKTPIEWGLDLAWLDEVNIRTGVFYAGKDLIDIIRLSFQPRASVESGSFSAEQIKDMNSRIAAVKNWCKTGVTYNLNCDHNPPGSDVALVDKWYNEGGTSATSSNTRAQRWAKLIDMTADYYKSKGLKNLVSISPFNEPDYGWEQGNNTARKADMKAICKVLKTDEAYKDKYEGIRMCGGNTLNDDKAYEWWNYMKDYLDEGNTHQLAGSFDNYASFFTKVREKGHHATADELHNVTEAMVGVEYGMQTGIWWGTCEKTRSDFMKATYQGNPGDRLAYAEHRDNWTSAAVYRQADGRVQAFGGTSERQAYTTVYKFGATDRPVWYNGQRGRSYVMNVAGGTGYQKGQTGFETVVDVQGGDDVMPCIDGIYKIVNVNSGYVLSASADKPSGWQTIKQGKNVASNPARQQWSVRPYTQENLSPMTLSGDRAYHIIKLNNGTDGTYIDIKDWNYNAGAEVGTYPGGFGTIEQWYLEYAGDNSFYIRSRYNTKCIEVKNSSKQDGIAVQMADIADKPNQKWRFVPVTVKPNTKAPAAPTNLTATANNASIDLAWEAPADTDLKSYTVLRSENGNDYYTLCNNITGTAFTDNEAEDGKTYYYKVLAEDESLLRSETTEAVSASTSGSRGLVMALDLDSNLLDTSANANHAAIYGNTSFTSQKDENCLQLSGSNNFLQLPYTIANHDELTISTWIYYLGGSSWQRIFDFGNGTDSYMFLSPTNGSQMRFAIKNGGDEQQISTTALTTGKWNHVVVTLGSEGGVIYVNGEKKAANQDISIKPSDINPIFNYIGRSQFKSDPDLKACIKGFQIYNYAMTADEVSQLATSINVPRPDAAEQNASQTYDLSGRQTTHAQGIVIKQGKKIKQ